jgi:hypothetical protein
MNTELGMLTQDETATAKAGKENGQQGNGKSASLSELCKKSPRCTQDVAQGGALLELYENLTALA